jgi:hypothetical protein
MKQIRSNWLFVPVLALGLAGAAVAHAKSGPTRYDLGKLPEGFEVHWPVAPKITNNVEVTTAQEFNEAAAAGHTEILVTRSIPGGVAISGSHVEVRMADGVSVGGLVIDRGARRIRLRGGEYGAGGIMMNYPASYSPPDVREEWVIHDVLIDGVHVSAAADRSALNLRGERVALINSTLRGGEYAIWSDTSDPLQNSDVIIANNVLQAEGDQATVRLVGVNHAVVVDNRMENLLQAGSKHNFRVHGTSDQVFAAHNLLVNAGSMLATMPGDDVGELWFEDNEIHHVTEDLFNPDPRQLAILHARDNVVYSKRSCFVCFGPSAAWDVEENAVFPYEPVKE